MAKKDSKVAFAAAPALATAFLTASADGIAIRWTTRSMPQDERNGTADQG